MKVIVHYQPLRKTVFLFLLLVVCLIQATVAANYLKPGSTLIVIPTAAKDDEIKSAKLISKWLNYIYQTDSSFFVVRENLMKDTINKVLIAIGNTRLNPEIKWDSAEPYSFRIGRKNKIINIQGATALATLLAATYFLDNECGVRFYLPGELFISEPKTRKINIDNIKSTSKTPFTKYVYSTGYMNYSLENYKNIAENYWAQINGLQRKNWGSHQHSMGERFFNDSVIKLFPEIFPMVNGQQYLPKSKTDQQWEPDFMEPKLVDAAVYSSIQYFKANPAIDYISFSVQDSYVYPTEGKMGVYIKNYPDTREGKKRGYTNAYVDFLNKLAIRLEKELPAHGITTPKTIVYIPYGYVSYLPLVKLNSIILPVTVNPLAGALKYLLIDDTGTVKKWSTVTNRIGNHDWAEGKGFIYPRIYTKLVSEYLKAVKRNNMQFEYAHIESYPNWSLDGPKYYFMSKLYWDPSVNPDSLLNLFCRDMFGKAANQMKAYFTHLETLNTSMNNDTAIGRNINGYLTQLPLNEYQQSLVTQARGYLNKAYSVAKTELQKKRIDFFSKGFKISEGFFNLYNTKVVDSSKVNEFRNYLSSEIAGNPMMLNMATDKDFVNKMNALVGQVLKSKR